MLRMKHVLNFGRPDSWKTGAGILCVILALVAGGGCGKSKSISSPVESPLSSNSIATVTPAETPPPARMQPSVPSVSVNTNSAGLTQIQMLNRAMLGWKIKNHRLPRTFEEFANSAGFQIPAPPAGKKYALDKNGFIILVNSN